ncbi:MAG: prepilin-type N-terminal cleavage/methylation domain-containing protein [bacterium]|nr:prepilin-type N-terminal cleavage/methylation domain-containing protein [bacterium]
MTSFKDFQGFTAVELLITLFVAALFITSGYQLYAITTADSADIRERSLASNIGYKFLRIAEAKGFFVCGTESPDNSEAWDQLRNVTDIKITRSMVFSGDTCGNGLMKIQVDIEYTSRGDSEIQTQVLYVNS